jgi:uncharacterized protein involved in exopolysaccharide biosynthesis
MEIKELISAYTKEKNLLVGLLMVGLIISLIAYLLPTKYISTGSLIVTRNTQGSDDYFTYEGYYAQQTARFYTDAAESLLESEDVRKKALEKIGIEPDKFSLRKLKKDIRTKRDNNQVLILETKDYEENMAATKWHAVAESLIELSISANKENDPDLNIVKISAIPITKQAYKSVWVYLLVGAAGGLLFGLVKVSYSEYLKKS